MEQQNLTASQSIDLIARTIRNTRQHIERGIYKPFLIWGYLTIIISLAIWAIIKHTGNASFLWLWFALPAAGWSITLTTRRKPADKGYVRTDIDRVISHVWVVLSLACLIASISSYFIGLPILFIVILLMCSGTAITGLTVRSRILSAAGLVGITLSILFFFVHGIDQCLVFAAIFLLTMVVPGHLLRHSATQNR
ncbi:MAG: hypothetical protein K2F95_05240 [Alistipes sp.]|nr:hypothetical protein [Alistipes sp.]